MSTDARATRPAGGANHPGSPQGRPHGRRPDDRAVGGARRGGRRPTTPRRSGNTRSSLLILLAIALALAGLGSLLEGLAWWAAATTFAGIVLAAAAAARYFFRPSWAGTLAALVAGVMATTVFFAADTALLGVIPTGDTWIRFAALTTAGNLSINEQGVPAVGTAGIVFLLCWLSAAIAIVIDMVAIWWRSPALGGIPLLIVLVVPNIVLADLANPLWFILTGVVYLLLIRPRETRVQPAVAISLGAIAVAGALIAPLLLPPITQSFSGNGGGFVSAEINPIIDLGDDLRRGSPTEALSYTTDSADGLYLRLTILEEFRGNQWQPSSVRPIPGNTVDAIGVAPGLAPETATVTASTDVTIQNATGRWLPVPYPSVAISGLAGNWSWEPDGLTVRSAQANMRGQEYTVTSLQLEPTSTQLAAAGDSSNSPLAQVPEGVDPIVAQTAAEVTGEATTDFDRAIALQDWFRGTFTYSEEAPVEAGFDGSGLDVLVPFLEAKSGYCVHFASAMAVMARTLGIPSRVVVGFLPGEQSAEADGLTTYDVSSRDLHAWPELYFAGVGWTRFEPTASRGVEPDYRPAPVDNPDTPDIDESQPSAAPEPSVAPSAAPSVAPEDQPDATGSASSGVGPATWWTLAGILAAVLILLVPGIARATVRARRFAAVRDGRSPAQAAWTEIVDTARDLDLIGPIAGSPRDVAATLQRVAGISGAPLLELGRLRAAVEVEAYAPATAAGAAADDASGAGVPAAGAVGGATAGGTAGDPGKGGGSATSVPAPTAAQSLTTVLRDLRSGAELSARFRAAFLPVTMFDRARSTLARQQAEK